MSASKDIYRQHLRQTQEANKRAKLGKDESDEDAGEHQPAPTSMPANHTPARKSKGDTLRAFVADSAVNLTTPEAQVAAGVVVKLLNGEDIGAKLAAPRRQSNTGSGSGSRPKQPSVTVNLLDSSDGDEPGDINLLFHRPTSHKELKDTLSAHAKSVVESTQEFPSPALTFIIQGDAKIIDILLEAKVFDPLLQSVCKLRGRSPDTMYQQFTAYMLASKDSWKKYMHINSSIGTNKYKAGMHLLFQCFLDCTSKLQSKITGYLAEYLGQVQLKDQVNTTFNDAVLLKIFGQNGGADGHRFSKDGNPVGSEVIRFCLCRSLGQNELLTKNKSNVYKVTGVPLVSVDQLVLHELKLKKVVSDLSLEASGRSTNDNVTHKCIAKYLEDNADQKPELWNRKKLIMSQISAYGIDKVRKVINIVDWKESAAMMPEGVITEPVANGVGLDEE